MYIATSSYLYNSREHKRKKLIMRCKKLNVGKREHGRKTGEEEIRKTGEEEIRKRKEEKGKRDLKGYQYKRKGLKEGQG